MLSSSSKSSFHAHRPLDLGTSEQEGRLWRPSRGQTWGLCPVDKAPDSHGLQTSPSPPQAVTPFLPASFWIVFCPWALGSQVPLSLQVICGKCSEFKAENGRQSRVCRECFLTQLVAPSSPSLEEPLEPKQSTEVGGLGLVSLPDTRPQKP